jgi:small conductance mechanosensitive channel
MEKVNNLNQYLLDLIKTYGPSLLLAIVTLVVGFWIIRFITRLTKRSLLRSKIEDSLGTFLSSTLSMLLKVLLVISVAGMVGIEMTSFIAILGAVGLAVGMALSGTLQNFAGGVMILIFKPFRVGDYIEAQGHGGIVNEIQIFNTILKTPDNKKIIIPNGGLSNSSMINYTAEETRRVDITYGISYQDDIDKAKGILQAVIDSNLLILNEPVPFIGVIELGDSSVNIVVRIWAKTSDYWNIYFYMQETVKKTFDKEGISIPFPQRDVHLYQTK